MTPRRLIALLFAVLTPVACSDSTEPTATVPRQLYYTAQLDTAPWGLQLYAAALDGSASLPLLTDSLLELYPLEWYAPVWVSPDGGTIKVVARSSSANGTRVILNLDRFGELQVIEPYGGGDDYWATPPISLSPDGGRQAWFAGGYLNIALVDGTIVQRTYFDSLRTFSSTVGWSRDGKWLAYVSGLRDSFNPYSGSTDQRVWVLRLSDGFKRPVTAAGEGRSGVAWSRDGRWLLFSSPTGLNRVPADGSGPEQSVYIGAAGAPSWGPDDSLIAFLHGGRIRVMQPDGSGGSNVPGIEGAYTFGWGN